jgi:hypothetical protein
MFNNDNMDFEFVKVESFPLNESETIVVEKSFDKFTLEFEGDSIDLSKPYEISTLAIEQDGVSISLENEQQLEYFKSVVKEIQDGDTETRGAGTEESKEGQGG